MCGQEPPPPPPATAIACCARRSTVGLLVSLLPRQQRDGTTLPQPGTLSSNAPRALGSQDARGGMPAAIPTVRVEQPRAQKGTPVMPPHPPQPAPNLLSIPSDLPSWAFPTQNKMLWGLGGRSAAQCHAFKVPVWGGVSGLPVPLEPMMSPCVLR